jgi:hypothetical protein
MMTRGEMLALADRVEREEPSEALNEAIADAVEMGDAPYTHSLDAAMTLVPLAWSLHEIAHSDHYQKWAATLWCISGRFDEVRGYAPTEVAARCAAALRARSSLLKEDGE